MRLRPISSHFVSLDEAASPRDGGSALGVLAVIQNGGAGKSAVRRKGLERKEMCQNGVPGPTGAVRRKSNRSKALTA